MRPGSGSERVLLVGLVLVALAVMIRTAWVCDDAYITLRVVDNLVHGYGRTAGASIGMPRARDIR